MNILKCIICNGEVDLIIEDRAVNKKVKCKKCGFTNAPKEQKEPEIIIMRKRSVIN